MGLHTPLLTGQPCQQRPGWAPVTACSRAHPCRPQQPCQPGPRRPTAAAAAPRPQCSSAAPRQPELQPADRPCKAQLRRRAPERPSAARKPALSVAAELDGRIFALLVPAMLAVLLDPAMAVVDAAIVGSLGTLPLGAAGLSNLVFFFFTVLFSFLLATTTPAVAAAKADGKDAEASATIVRSLWVALLSGLGVGLVLWHAAPWLFHSVFKLERSQALLAVPHLQMRALGSPAAVMLFVLNGAYRGLTDTRTPLVAGALQNGVNLGLDIGLVLCLGWGVSGAAGAAAAGQWVGAAAMITMLVLRGALQVGDLGVLPTPTQFWAMLRQGAPLVVCVGAVISAVFAATNLATGLGSTSLAAHTVVKQITDFCMGLMGSFSTAAQSLVAAALGQGNKEEARAVVLRLLQIGLQVGAALALGLLLGRDFLPHLFSGDAAVIGLAQSTLLLVAGAMVIAPCLLTLEGSLLGAQAFPWVGGRTIAAAAGSGGVLWAAHHYSWGLTGVWLGLMSLIGLNGLSDALRLSLPGSPLDGRKLVQVVDWRQVSTWRRALPSLPSLHRRQST